MPGKRPPGAGRTPAAPRRRAEPAADPAAAAEVFTQRGLDATLDDVARQAGVGVGTVYRRFPDKESLVAELFQDRIDTLVAVAEEAGAAPDPWQALVSYLEYAAACMAGDLGLRQLMMFATYGKDRVAYARDQMRPVDHQAGRARAGRRRPAPGLRRDRREADRASCSPRPPSTPAPSTPRSGDATSRCSSTACARPGRP